jgi:uncharacterized protein (DUF2236 family)
VAGTSWQASLAANLALSIVKRPRAWPRFAPRPRRWIIARILPPYGRCLRLRWLTKNRRMVRDFAPRADAAKTLLRIAATATMPRRITSTPAIHQIRSNTL